VEASSDPALIGTRIFLGVHDAESSSSSNRGFVTNDVVEINVHETATAAPPNDVGRPAPEGAAAGTIPFVKQHDLSPPAASEPGARMFRLDNVVRVNSDRRLRVRSRQRRGGAGDDENRSVVLIRVEFTDEKPECDEACVRDMMWGTGSAKPEHHVAGLFNEASFGKLRFDGTGTPSEGNVFTVKLGYRMDSLAGCPYEKIGEDADQAFRNQFGFDPELLKNQVYIVPEDLRCGWQGIAYIADCIQSYCKSWVRQGGALTLAHELGHSNLGLHHAAIDADDDGVVEDDYGDRSGIMGIASWWRSFTAPHRVLAGWVGESAIATVARPPCGSNSHSKTVVVELTALHIDSAESSTTSVVKIERLGPGRGDYYLGFRAAVGYDVGMPITQANRVQVHYISSESWEVPEDEKRCVCLLCCLLCTSLGSPLAHSGGPIWSRRRCTRTPFICWRWVAALVASQKLVPLPAAAAMRQVAYF
jgi:hypothetical protein